MKTKGFLKICLMAVLIFHTSLIVAADHLPRLKVSSNQRYLVLSLPWGKTEIPFFYQGDTAWELFHRLDREEADYYLSRRASQGFTVIQAVAIAELDGPNQPNPYGDLPLEGRDPSKPAIREGAANDYWDHVDYIVDRANHYGLYIGFLPTWGRYWHEDPVLFNQENAEAYGEFLGKRYREKGIIWILGGDRVVENGKQKEILRAMARGLKKGDEGAHLITFHPRGGRGSAEDFHNEKWLDFNMRQNGHNADFSAGYIQTLKDYQRTPVKPVIDGEPLYEDHPLSFNAGKLGHSLASDVRRPLYWDLFNGAFGHTYGHHSVWQMFDPEKQRNPVNNPLMSWKEAVEQPGAGQMVHARNLLLSRPFLSRIPDPSLVVPGKVVTSVPGEGRYRFTATRDEEGSYIMVYVPAGRPFSVNTGELNAGKIKAWWFNPRNGKATLLGTFANAGVHHFTPPEPGEALDWVLVLDDVSRKYGPPGKRKLR